jgi:hypothetical protein
MKDSTEIESLVARLWNAKSLRTQLINFPLTSVFFGGMSNVFFEPTNVIKGILFGHQSQRIKISHSMAMDSVLRHEPEQICIVNPVLQFFLGV